LALFALIIAQIFIAQHSATHINHGLSFDQHASHAADNDHPDHQNNKKHECPECLLTKSLQTAFYSIPSVVSIVTVSNTIASRQEFFIVGKENYKANIARAPPVFLI
jgi:hypothetical protein